MIVQILRSKGIPRRLAPSVYNLRTTRKFLDTGGLYRFQFADTFNREVAFRNC